MPEILQVGERSPQDKKYQTREVVLAPEGTVVAPLPKGVEPTMENAVMALLAQLLGGVGPGAAKRPGVRGMKDGGVTSGYDPSGMLQAALGLYGQASQNNQFNMGRKSSEKDYDVYRQAANERAARSVQAYADRSGRGGDSGGGSNSTAYNQSRLDRAEELRLAKEQRAEDNAWRYKQIEMQRYGIDQETGVARQANSIRGQEVGNQFSLGQRQLGLQQAADQFARIMAGLSEASLGGSTPTQGLYS